MNLGVFYDSCNYTSDNYNLLSKLSIYTFELLTQRNHSKHKFQTAVSKVDIEVVELLIDYEDNIVNYVLDIFKRSTKPYIYNTNAYRDMTKYIHDNNVKEVVAVFVKKSPKDFVDHKTIIEYFCAFEFIDCIKILISTGIFNFKIKYLRDANRVTNCDFIKFLIELVPNYRKTISLRTLSSSYTSLKAGLECGIRKDMNNLVIICINTIDYENLKLLIEYGAKPTPHCIQRAQQIGNRKILQLLKL